MSVFIGWSGKNTRSHKVAALLKSWLPKVIQKLPCFLSSHDIEAGATWIKELFARLDESDVGILCVTQKSMSRPWMFFEAGALAKKLDESRVCPLLIDVQPSDVPFPLAAFQLKTISKEDMQSVVEMVNRTWGGEALSAEELAEVFEFRWPMFEAELKKILSESDTEAKHTKTRPDRELLEEVLTLTRGIASGGIKVVPEEQLMRDTLRAEKGPTATLDASPIATHLIKAVPSRGFLRTLIDQVDHYGLEDDVFVMSFPQEKKSMVEALSSRNNIATIEKIINEVKPLKMRIQVNSG